VDVDVTTWYLQMTDPAALRWSAPPREPVEIVRAELPSPELNRFLYTAVGGDWFWGGRLSWTWQQWYEWLNRPAVETWVAYRRGTPAGYVELEGQPGGDVEIAYFGLFREAIGFGLGGFLLSFGIDKAWTIAQRWPDREPTKRVWVHTCSLDGAAALPNYEARGLIRYDTRVSTDHLPEQTYGPWPGAQKPVPTP
jgi:hypothetical protein